MEVTRLILQQFRCYETLDIELSGGANLIQGKNGSGKTSLVEALIFLSTGRSFLTSHLTDLINENSSHFYIEAHFTKDGAHQTLSVGLDKGKKHILYNTTKLHSLSHLLGILPSVLYCPKDVSLIMGMPQERRRFLNIQLAQSDPLYVHHLTRYHQAMKQRNALLKIKSEHAIETFEEVMAHSACHLMEKRAALVERLRPTAEKTAKELSFGEDHFDLYYRPSIALHKKEEIAPLLAKCRPKELLLGTTLIGPHRDDIQMLYGHKEAKTFASEGQKRTCIAALKLAEWEILKEQSNTPPLFAIDDFCVHLDPKRSEVLEDKLSALGQVILTSPADSPLQQKSLREIPSG